MPAQSLNCYADTCSRLNSQLADYLGRVRVSDNNKKIKADCDEKIKTFSSSLRVCDAMLEIFKPMLNDVKRYINEKKAEAMQNVNNALRLSCEIVPDATPGIHFELDGDKAYLLTEDGLFVDDTEGGGLRQISSVFLRAVIAKANPGILNTLFLDEVFSQVSQENSATLSLYLNLLTQDTQIISIEQKPQVYSNIDSTIYRFQKTGDYSTVTKEVVTREEENE